MHLAESILRAFLDHQLDEQAELEAGRHLDDCEPCRLRLNLLAQRRETVQSALGSLQSDQPVNSPVARAYSKLMSIKENHAMKRSFFARSRLLWAALTLLLVLVVSLSFPTVRAWAGQFLGLFRVEQVTVLPLDLNQLENTYAESNLFEAIGTTLAESIEFSKQPSDPYAVASVDEASAAVGFKLRVPAGETPQMVEVQDGFSFKLRLDRELAQSLLNDAGRSDLVLPESLDNADISATVNAGAMQYFGDCKLKEQGNNIGNCKQLLQIQSPVVETPPDLDLAQLAQIGLVFAGMSERDAVEFSQSIDWNVTLVVPIAAGEMRHENVTVDGVQGSLIHNGGDPVAGNWHYILLWVKDGIVYCLTATGSPNDGLIFANALQ